MYGTYVSGNGSASEYRPSRDSRTPRADLETEIRFNSVYCFTSRVEFDMLACVDLTRSRRVIYWTRLACSQRHFSCLGSEIVEPPHGTQPIRGVTFN